jgi:hypothetical protein
MPTNIVDSSATLESIRLLGSAGSVTISGYYCDEFGNQVSASFTATISATTAFEFADALAIPANGSFVRVLLTGDVRISTGGATYESDFETNKSRYPIEIAVTSGYNVFGRGGN